MQTRAAAAIINAGKGINMSTTNEFSSNNSASQGEMSVFKPFNKVSTAGSTYLINRHFGGKRDFKQAVFAVVENEARREFSSKKLS